MKRKDIILILSKYFGRYPTVVEINYFERTGQVKQTGNFTPEEHVVYNPSPKVLEQTHKYIMELVYMWQNRNKIKTKLIKREQLEKAKARAMLRKEIEGLRQLKWEASEERKRGFFIRKGNNAPTAIAWREKEIERIIWANGRENARRALEYHLNHDSEPSAEMKAITDKYK